MLQSFDKVHKVLFTVGQWGFIYFLHYVFVTCTDKLELGERIEFMETNMETQKFNFFSKKVEI